MKLLELLLPSRRRARLFAEPFNPAWRTLIERNVAIFKRLPPADQAELLGHVNVFLAEKKFEGCGGLTLTDEIRVSIAAQACLLLLHRPDPGYYPELITILVYPTSYFLPNEESLGGGAIEEREDHVEGHTQKHLGALVLEWHDARLGMRDPSDGHNLILHEFAHQLDFEQGMGDGTPALDTREQYAEWGRVFQQEFEALQKAAEDGESTVLDVYGATNPAEFFAVATETFFEKPRALLDKHPKMYALMKAYYEQDPATYNA